MNIYTKNPAFLPTKCGIVSANKRFGVHKQAVFIPFKVLKWVKRWKMSGG